MDMSNNLVGPTRVMHMDWSKRVTHAVPRGQPENVLQIAQRLFSAYTIDGGRVHLAGCTLEDRLFARLQYQQGEAATGVYVDGDGQELDLRQVDALGLVDTTPLEKPSPQAGPQLARFLTLVAPALEQRNSTGPQDSAGRQGELLSITLVWCKFAEGKLRFTLGEESVDLPFADWARTLQPPPFVCRYTGVQTFHLAGTDDARIVPAECIGRCAETGRRTLADELVTCSVTGKQVLSELAPACPVSGQAVLRRAMAVCEMCGEAVSPAVVKRGRCAACRGLRSIDKADPRMARLLDEHPELDRWGHWRMAETATVYILVASGWLQRLLVTADKETLMIKRLATGNRLQSHWNVVNPAQHRYVLKD